jgi:hypothetical protein
MRLLLWTAALVLVSSTINASPAAASCAAGAGPAGSPTIFLGVAGDTSGGYTTMTVEEVWAGPALPPSVKVLSGQTEPRVQSSVDAVLERGHRYVIGADRDLHTNACTVEEVESTAATDAAMSLRPDHVRQPTTRTVDDAEGDDSVWILVVAGLGLVLAASAAFVTIRVRTAR